MLANACTYTYKPKTDSCAHTCERTTTLLSSLIPGAEHWPKFKRNISEKFESRLIQVVVNESPSIFFNGMEGAVIPIPVAHGEGRAEGSKDNIEELIRSNLSTISYADDRGLETENYPDNPNGSPLGIGGLTNQSGTVNIMMPHPERAFLTDQFSWCPDDWEDYSPWVKFFLNARDFIK